jgi:alpha-L-fucosidase
MKVFWLNLSLIAFFGISCLCSSASVSPVYPIPSKQQVEWQELEYIFFAHFGVNTFTNREWGDGTENPEIFNPSEFDGRQWAKAAKDAGAKLLILTCKHHDGFCLWPSEYTEHSVKNSSWKNGKGDIVKEISEACREYGIKFGVYLSPWDRNNKSYGDSPVYNKYFLNQLTELLTNYGEVTEVWFDGACGEGPNGKRQVYDFNAYFELIRKFQPNAMIAIMGPDIRWVGNESGVASESEWSVQPVSSEGKNDPRVIFNPTLKQGITDFLPKVDEKDIAFSHLSLKDGSAKMADLIWYPAETDVSIRPGWFYHASQDEKVKSLEHLIKIYFESVGRNSLLLLNIPPDKRGLFHENDVSRLKELKKYLDLTFNTDLALGASAKTNNFVKGHGTDKLVDGDDSTYWAAQKYLEDSSVVVDFGKTELFDVILLREPIEIGQRVAEFEIDVMENGSWRLLSKGTTIGYKQLVRLPVTSAQKIRVRILKSRGLAAISQMSVYKRPPVVMVNSMGSSFEKDISIMLNSDIASTMIFYTLDGSKPTVNSTLYRGPFKISESAVLKAIAQGGLLVTTEKFERNKLFPAVNVEKVKTGLNYKYYEGGWQTLDNMPNAKIVSEGLVDSFDIKNRKRDNHFAFEFSGYFWAPVDGSYSFYLSSDDGARLYLHDSLLIDNDGLHGMGEKKSNIGLKKGLHPIKLQYFNATGDLGLKLYVEGPGLEKQVVPDSFLKVLDID